jgi:hypothetical protein
MSRYGRFVPQSTIERRMEGRDARINAEIARRQRRIVEADTRMVGATSPAIIATDRPCGHFTPDHASLGVTFCACG